MVQFHASFLFNTLFGTGREENKMIMRKITINTLFISSAIFLVSCKEPTPKEKMEQVIDNYMQEKFKEEQKNNPELIGSIQLDSIHVQDTITEQKKLGYEMIDLRKEAQRIMEEGKQLAEEFQSKNDMLAMYLDISNGTDAYTTTLKHDIEGLKKQWEEKRVRGEEIVKLLEEKRILIEKADSIKPLYYYVFAYYTANDDKMKTKSLVLAPFHISTDFMIVKEPDEILKED